MNGWQSIIIDYSVPVKPFAEDTVLTFIFNTDNVVAVGSQLVASREIALELFVLVLFLEGVKCDGTAIF